MSQELIERLDEALQAGSVSVRQVESVLAKHGAQTASSEPQSNKLLQILSYIGGGIVFLGVAFWIGQEWQHFGSIAKILSTLGIALGFFVSAVLHGKHPEQSTLSSVFFLLAAALMPLGLGVTYDELGVDVDNYAIATQIALILSAVFLAAYFLFKRNLLLLISMVFITGLFFVVTDWMTDEAPRLMLFGDIERFTLYRFLAAGATWILLGHAFKDSERQPLTSWLYMFGAFTVLLTGLILGDWKPNQSVFWEIVYPGMALGFVFLSVHLKSRSFLVFGSLGFGAYLCKITAEYFSDSLGWPLALILMGLSLIGVAFAAVRIKNRHLSHA